MNIADLQRELKASGRYAGKIDGKYGPMSRAAVDLAMTDGPDTRLTASDYDASARRLGVTPAHVVAVTQVESPVSGFKDGKPTILFEPHVFCRMTAGRYDKSHPHLSYPKWNRNGYPRAAARRWDQLIEAVGLSVDAGFASASYGRFQILGVNYRAAGYDTPYHFAQAMAFDEATQLRAFESFLLSRGLQEELGENDFEGFAKIYNGPGYRENDYAGKLRRAFAAAGGTVT